MPGTSKKDLMFTFYETTAWKHPAVCDPEQSLNLIESRLPYLSHVENGPPCPAGRPRGSNELLVVKTPGEPLKAQRGR